MPEHNKDNINEINSLLKGIFHPASLSLKELFDRKVAELKIAPTAVLEILDIQHRTLKGILEGTQKMVDFTNLIKIAIFLQLPREQVIKLYLEELDKNFLVNTTTPDKIQFIKENFDLAVLKKAGFIENISDFEQIEKRIITRLGLRSIFEYKKPPNDVAFSSGLFKPKNELTRSFWIYGATTCFEEINNPYEFDRTALISFFPQIRWYSMNVKQGMLEVIKCLFKIGITVIYQPPLQTLQLRGATFSVNDKPCIVLTNYLGFYPTLWFALIHELYHVLFDWDEIRTNSYHLSDDSNEQLSVRQKEIEADRFAREYLFSTEKTEFIKPHLNDPNYVKNFALDNHVHPSIIYVFHAFDLRNNRTAWAKARKLSPDVHITIEEIDIPWTSDQEVGSLFKNRKQEIYY